LEWREVINVWTVWRYYITWWTVQFMCGSLCFVSSRQQLSAPLAICSQLQPVSSVVRHGAVHLRATCISVCHPCEYGPAGKCRQKFWRKFHDERVPSRRTVHNLVNKLRTTGLLIDKKQKHKRQVLTVEKLHDIRVRLERIPRKSLKHLVQETGVSKSRARMATQLLKPSNESWCLVCCICKKEYCTCFLTKQLQKKSMCRKDSIFNTSCDLWIVTTSFQTLPADLSAKFTCTMRQAAHQPLWSAEP
jgi:hypothetical protein